MKMGVSESRSRKSLSTSMPERSGIMRSSRIKIVAAGFGFAQAFGGVGRQIHVVAFQFQQRGQAFANLRFVVNH